MRRTALVGIGWCATVAVTAAVAWWGSRATFSPPQPQSTAMAAPTYTVADGTIGRTAALSTVVTWPARPVGSASVDGVVTTVAVKPGQAVDVGDALLTINLVPVVVAEGAVPAFRDLTPGVTGEDVRQLQQMLVAEGHLRSTQVKGTFDSRTGAAVKAWQKSMSVEQTGTVARGAVLFLPELPVRVALEDGVGVGVAVSTGDPLVRAVDPAPTFHANGNPDQRSDIPPVGTGVTVEVDGTTFTGLVHAIEPAENGNVRVVLTAADGGALCGTQCGIVPFSLDELPYPGVAQIAPEVTGPMVPVSTMGTAADGSAFVVRHGGERVPVRVLASDGARAVVEGLRIGEVVELFGAAGEAQSTGEDTSPGGTASPTSTP